MKRAVTHWDQFSFLYDFHTILNWLFCPQKWVGRKQQVFFTNSSFSSSFLETHCSWNSTSGNRIKVKTKLRNFRVPVTIRCNHQITIIGVMPLGQLCSCFLLSDTVSRNCFLELAVTLGATLKFIQIGIWPASTLPMIRLLIQLSKAFW